MDPQLPSSLTTAILGALAACILPPTQTLPLLPPPIALIPSALGGARLLRLVASLRRGARVAWLILGVRVCLTWSAAAWEGTWWYLFPETGGVEVVPKLLVLKVMVPSPAAWGGGRWVGRWLSLSWGMVDTGFHQPLTEEATEETDVRRRKTEAMEERRDETDVRWCSMLESRVSWAESLWRDSMLRQGIVKMLWWWWLGVVGEFVKRLDFAVVCFVV